MQIFNTVLRTPDNVKVIVPNSVIISSNIKSYSVFENRLIDLVAAIVYNANIRVTREFPMEMAKSHPLVLSSHAPTVEILELAENSLNLAVRPWVLSKNLIQKRKRRNKLWALSVGLY